MLLKHIWGIPIHSSLSAIPGDGIVPIVISINYVGLLSGIARTAEYIHTQQPKLLSHSSNWECNA